MQKKHKTPRKKIIYLYGLKVLFRRRTTEEERSTSPSFDNFLHVALALANKVITREVDPIDETKNRPLLAFIQTWTEFQEEPEYIIHKFGYFQGANHIHGLSGNTERQFKALDTLVNMLDDYKEFLRVPSYQEARIRAAHEYITAMRERKISSKASHMTNAAIHFNKFSGHKYQVNKRAYSLSLFFKSQAAKYDAFAYMNQKPVPNLSLCIGKMKEAAILAGKAVESNGASQAMQKHFAYCNYWLNIFQMRERMLQHKLDNVREYHLAAIEAANFFGSSIFPNHFRSINDVNNYSYFITAYEQFCARAFDDSLKSLHDWEDASQMLHGDSWTFISVKLRRLMVELILIRSKEDSALSILDQMVNLVRHEFVGRASRCIVAVCYQLVHSGYQEFDEAYNQLTNMFPLDMYIEQEDEPLNIEDFQLDIKDIVDRIPLPFSIYFSGDELLSESKLLDSLLLKYFCVLHEYISGKTGSMKAHWKSLNEFIEDFKTDDIIWTPALLSSLLEYTNIANDDSKSILDKLHVIKEGILSESFAHFPHVVRINRIDNDSVELIRLWKDYRCDTLRINFHGVHHNLAVGRYYYMHPEWNRKKLHVLDVHHGDGVPLSPADYYEDNLSLISTRYNAYQEFLRLLEEPSIHESAFRNIVGENPWMIEPSSEFHAKEVSTKPYSRRKSPRADLILMSTSGLCTIVEFKIPTFLESALGDVSGQLIKYTTELECFNENIKINKKIIVACRSNCLNKKWYSALSKQSIELITYDELQKRIEDTLGFAVEKYNYRCDKNDFPNTHNGGCGGWDVVGYGGWDVVG